MCIMAMTRFSLRLSLFSFSLSFLLAFGIHTTSYDHAYLDRIAADLAPETPCVTACFMGIQTDTMTREAVRRALQNHPWAAADFMEFDNFFVWYWSGAQPAIIDETVPGVVQMNRLGTVQYIVVETRATLHHLQAALGKPDAGIMNWGYDAFSYRIQYHERGLRAIVSARCPATAFDVPSARAALIWQESRPGELNTPYQPPRWNIPLCTPKR